MAASVPSEPTLPPLSARRLRPFTPNLSPLSRQVHFSRPRSAVSIIAWPSVGVDPLAARTRPSVHYAIMSREAADEEDEPGGVGGGGGAGCCAHSRCVRGLLLALGDVRPEAIQRDQL